MVPEDNLKLNIAKYFTFFRIRFIAGLQYRAAALAGIATQFFWGFMQILIYKTFYMENADAFPMAFQAVTSYIWLQQSFLALFMPWILEDDIFKTISDGDIAYEMCRPIDIYTMWFVKNMSNRLSKALLRSAPILMFAVLIKKPYGISLPYNLNALIWFIITSLLGMMVVVAFTMYIYIISFFTLSPVGLRIVMIGLSEFFTGSIIPLPFLPEKIRRIVELLPFASMQNVPLRIYSGNINGIEIYLRTLLQMIWLIILVFFGKKLLRKAERRVIVQGG